MSLPTFTAEMSIYKSTACYANGADRASSAALVEPADIGGVVLGGVLGGIDVTIGEVVLTAVILKAITKAMPSQG